ncbi:hypothetical protein Bca52824_023531 [Brassica carinata]|uniref:DUF1985 domain-containing protein n=1 Tax=Brassica carinata TaxID=52824 RepID=A0A8X7VIP2_BRACI|nr:hypothetical protein Bca52824_023531 [Brassica carinata]
MRPKKRKTTSESPAKKTEATDVVEPSAKMKKGTDLVAENKTQRRSQRRRRRSDHRERGKKGRFSTMASYCCIIACFLFFLQAVEDIAVEPSTPNGFFFKPKDYWKSCKLQSRCHQHKFMTTLEVLDESEKRWFLEHPQFKHLLHMDCTPTRKVMGLWMLLIRTIVTHKSRQAWFAVNGVPIRYSIRERCLISGLYCHQYPKNYQSVLSMEFAEKQFRKMFMKKMKKMKRKTKKKPEEEELKEISSILAPIEREQQVIYETMDEGCWEDMELLDDGDDHDAIVDGWNKFIVSEGGQIFWEDIFMEDTKSRTLEIEQQEVEKLEEHETGNEHEAENEPERIRGGETVADLESLKEMVMSLMSQTTTMEGKINNKLEDFDRRLKVLEGDDSIGIENMDFQNNHSEEGGTSGQKDKDDGNDADKVDGKDGGKKHEEQECNNCQLLQMIPFTTHFIDSFIHVVLNMRHSSQFLKTNHITITSFLTHNFFIPRKNLVTFIF